MLGVYTGWVYFQKAIMARRTTTYMLPADFAHTIRLGRAYVRLIEAADLILASPLEQADMIDLQAAREFAKRRLREIVADAEPAVTAQIMAASEKVLGPVQEVGRN